MCVCVDPLTHKDQVGTEDWRYGVGPGRMSKSRVG